MRLKPVHKLAPFAATGLAVLILSGCVSSIAPNTDISQPLSAPLAVGGPDTFPTDFADVRLRSKDRVSIRVLREPELSSDNLRIGEDGFVDIPFIGRVEASGKSTAQLAEDIRARLTQEYLRDPRVAVNVVEFGSHLVTVEGAVTQPGIYQYLPDTTLLGAVALARGPTRVAKLGQVAIFRVVDGARSVAIFDLKQVRAGRMTDPRLVPGDRVLIGFDGLSQSWQDFLQAAPLLGQFKNF